MTITPTESHAPPTARLPPIKSLQSRPVDELIRTVRYLRDLYNPEVRGTSRIGQHQIFPKPHDTTSGTSRRRHSKTKGSITGGTDNQTLRKISSDEFERSYAIRWLTALISQGDCLAVPDGLDDLQLETYNARCELLIDEAAALLAICAGVSSAGTVSRTFVFTHDTDLQVKIQVRDAPLENHDYSSVGAQTWGSACLLSEMIVDAPDRFGLDLSSLDNPIRILELGAGTGLVTLTTANLLHNFLGDNLSESASIIATDFHISVLGNLQHNISLNVGSSSIQTHFLDWSKFPFSPRSPPFDTPFDVIFGADIIYEMEHAQWIHDCLQILLRMPDDPSRMPCFHLVIPLRRTHQVESHAVDFAFPAGTPYFPRLGDTSIPILGIIRKDMIVCESGDSVRFRASESDVVEYMHYTIAWINPATARTGDVDRP